MRACLALRHCAGLSSSDLLASKLLGGAIFALRHIVSVILGEFYGALYGNWRFLRGVIVPTTRLFAYFDAVGYLVFLTRYFGLIAWLRG